MTDLDQTTVLIIDDEESIRTTFRHFLEKEGYRVATAETFQEGLNHLEEGRIDAIFTDILLGPQSGVDFLRQVKEKDLQIPVVMITGEPNLKSSIDSLRLGAFDYLPKPVDKQKLLETAFRALRFRRLLLDKRRADLERERMRSRLRSVFDAIGEGLLLVDVEGTIHEINRAALSLLGETEETLVGRRLPDEWPHLWEPVAETVEKINLGIHTQGEWTLEHPLDRGSPGSVLTKVIPSYTSTQETRMAVVVLRDITRLRNLEDRVTERTGLHNMIGRSKAMQEVYRLVDMLRNTDTTVLIQGESGTGKELVALAIHYQGHLAKGPFVAVNCTALNEQLLESELFGHVRGAFTGAVANKVGRFEAAEGGTIFLDEIGDISPALQVKLLRVLQERVIERVGEIRPRKVNVRVVAATNADLEARMRAGLFREDLFYRLNVVRIRLPPLREKREDIPLLVEHFRKKLLPRTRKTIEEFSDETLAALQTYDWPGNVRELENAIEHALIMCNGPRVEREHLPKPVWERPPPSLPSPSPPPEPEGAPAGPADSEKERLEIEWALRSAHGNRSHAAKLLRINRTTLYRRMERLGMVKEEGGSGG